MRPYPNEIFTSFCIPIGLQILSQLLGEDYMTKTGHAYEQSTPGTASGRCSDDPHRL